MTDQPAILFATPMYGGQCTEPFFHSAMRTVQELDRIGLPYDWLTEKNESLVHRARMEMTATFLRRPEFSHLFWIDADIEFEPQHVAALWNLCDAGADIAVGVYAMKKREEQWFAAWKDGQLVKDLDQWSGPAPVDLAGTGFLLMTRKVVEALYEKLRAAEEMAAEICRRLVDIKEISAVDFAMIQRAMIAHYAASWQGAHGPVPALFMTPIHDGGLESEDYHFCRIAREAGFKVMMDPAVRLKHWGQYAFGA